MVTVLYRPNSEHAHEVEEFERLLKKRDPDFEMEMVNVDSKRGTQLVELYDLPRYPAVITTDSNGRPLQTWQGKLPTISDVTYWASQ